MSEALSQLIGTPVATEAGGVRPQTAVFTTEARRPWCTWNGFHGGALMGVMASAMEQLAGKPAVSVTTQYLKGVKEGDLLSLRAEVLAASASITQARVFASRGEDLVATAFATLGAGGAATPAAGGAATSAPRPFPNMKPPLETPLRTYLRAPIPGDVAETLETRIAAASATGAALWMRCASAAGQPMTAALLAAFADHPPFAVRLALGGEWYGISLDTGLRVAAPVAQLDAGQWVLVEIAFDAMVPPFAFGTAYIWTESGQLIAISPQAMRIRNGAR